MAGCLRRCAGCDGLITRYVQLITRYVQLITRYVHDSHAPSRMCTLPLCELLEGALGVPLVLAVPWHEEQQQIDLVQAMFC